MTIHDFTTELFVRVDDAMTDQQKHSGSGSNWFGLGKRGLCFPRPHIAPTAAVNILSATAMPKTANCASRAVPATSMDAKIQAVPLIPRQCLLRRKDQSRDPGCLP